MSCHCLSAASSSLRIGRFFWIQDAGTVIFRWLETLASVSSDASGRIVTLMAAIGEQPAAIDV